MPDFPASLSLTHTYSIYVYTRTQRDRMIPRLGVFGLYGERERERDSGVRAGPIHRETLARARKRPRQGGDSLADESCFSLSPRVARHGVRELLLQLPPRIFFYPACALADYVFLIKITFSFSTFPIFVTLRGAPRHADSICPLLRAL